MERVGAVDVVLPELAALAGVEQSAYHHLDVYGHTLAVLAEAVALERDPAARLRRASTARRVAALLAEPLADELTRGGALRFGALLHDVAKPQTRAVGDEGRVSFSAHDAQGAELARDDPRAAARERAAARARRRAHAPPPAARLPRAASGRCRARVEYRYLKACEPVEVDVTLLSVADRLATRGRRCRRGDREAPRARARADRPGARVARARARRRRSCAATSWPTRSGSRAARGSARCSPSWRRPPTPARSRTREDAIAHARTLLRAATRPSASGRRQPPRDRGAERDGVARRCRGRRSRRCPSASGSWPAPSARVTEPIATVG